MKLKELAERINKMILELEDRSEYEVILESTPDQKQYYFVDNIIVENGEVFIIPGGSY